jgi:hypothetical protein
MSEQYYRPGEVVAVAVDGGPVRPMYVHRVVHLLVVGTSPEGGMTRKVSEREVVAVGLPATAEAVARASGFDAQQVAESIAEDYADWVAEQN